MPQNVMMDKHAAYHELRALAAQVPDFEIGSDAELPDDAIRWLARLEALLEIAGLSDLASDVRVANGISALRGPFRAASTYRRTIIRGLVRLELVLPAAERGTFIPAGNEFDFMAKLGSVLEEASNDILLIDPYMDQVTLTDFAPMASERVTIRLLADAQYVKSSLRPAVERWRTQYDAVRPLEARVAAGRTLHDRAVIIDGTTVWIVSQSFKDFAKRSHGTVSRLDPEAGQMKADAYGLLWAEAAALE